MRSILQFDGWILDSDALSVAWQSPRPGPLSQLKTFGIIFEDPKYPLHPSVLRNMQTILQKCSAAGHRLIPLGHLLPTDIIHTTALTSMTILNMDPDKTPIGYIARGGEPPVPSMSLMALPELEKMKPNINGVFNLNTDIANLRTLFRKIVVDNELDAILMPVYQSTAVPHDVMRVPAYTLLANILDVSIIRSNSSKSYFFSILLVPYLLENQTSRWTHNSPERSHTLQHVSHHQCSHNSRIIH